MHSLNLVAYLYTTHTFDTFACITYQWISCIPFFDTDFLLIRAVYNIQIISNHLKCTISASYTSCTLCIVLGKDHLYRMFSVSAYFRTVGIDRHSFFYHVITGCYQMILSFNFYNADSARSNLIDIF